MTNEASMGTRVTEEMVELAARNILRAEGVSWIEADGEWRADVARYREMSAKWQDYAATVRGQIPDAFRAARAALSAALAIPDAKPDGNAARQIERFAILRNLGENHGGENEAAPDQASIDAAVAFIRRWGLPDNAISTVGDDGCAVLELHGDNYADITFRGAPPIPSAKPDAWISEDLSSAITARALANIPELGGDPSPLYPIPLFRGSNERLVDARVNVPPLTRYDFCDPHKFLLLASYCGGDNPGCTENDPCVDCIRMCNAYDAEGKYAGTIKCVDSTEPRADEKFAFNKWLRKWTHERFGKWIAHSTANSAYREFIDARATLSQGGQADG